MVSAPATGCAAPDERGPTDGDPDVVAGNEGQMRIYFNLLRQLDSPLLAVAGRDWVLDVFARYGPPREQDLA